MVSEEVTLDAFASERSGDDEAAAERPVDDADGRVNQQAEKSERRDGEYPISPVSIYDPEGTQCAGCAEIVERLFQTEGERRCPDCTAWQSSA